MAGVVLALLAACQTTDGARKAIAEHEWTKALADEGAQFGRLEVATDIMRDGGRHSVEASLPYFRLRPKDADFTLVLLHGDPGGKEVWAPACLGPHKTFAKPALETEEMSDAIEHLLERRLVLEAFHQAGWDSSFELIAIDLPGHGQAWTSERLVEPEEIGQVLDAAITALGEEETFRGRLVLVGHSFGGEIAWRMASSETAANSISRLVLIDSVGMVRKPCEILNGEESQAGFWMGWLLGGIGGALECNASAGLEELYEDDALIEANCLAPLYRAYINHGSNRWYRAFVQRDDNYWVSRLVTKRDLARQDDDAAKEALGSIRIPVLLVWGEDDPAWPIETQGLPMLYALRNSPETRLLAIKCCGHLPTEERPDVLAEAVRSWLEGTPRAEWATQALSRDLDREASAGADGQNR